MRAFDKRINPLLRILPHIQIEQIDVADMVVWVGIESAARKLRFVDPQNAPMDLGIANLGQGI